MQPDVTVLGMLEIDFPVVVGRLNLKALKVQKKVKSATSTQFCFQMGSAKITFLLVNLLLFSMKMKWKYIFLKLIISPFLQSWLPSQKQFQQPKWADQLPTVCS